MDWIHMVQDKVLWQVLVNIVMILKSSIKVGTSLD